MFYHGFFLFFRPPIAELDERNLTEIGHMVGSKCSLKRMSKIWGIPSPLQIGGPKSTFIGRLYNLTATLTAYVFGTKHDIDKYM